jgi:hypothetical protein
MGEHPRIETACGDLQPKLCAEGSCRTPAALCSACCSFQELLPTVASCLCPHLAFVHQNRWIGAPEVVHKCEALYKLQSRQNIAAVVSNIRHLEAGLEEAMHTVAEEHVKRLKMLLWRWVHGIR